MNKYLVCMVAVILSGCTMDAPFMSGGAPQEIKLNPVKPKCGDPGSDCALMGEARFKMADLASPVSHDEDEPRPKAKTKSKVKKSDAAIVEGGTKAGSKKWAITTEDLSVKYAMTRWAKDAGWQFKWDAPKDFPATVNASFTGTFQDAVEGVMKSLAQSEMPIRACASNGNKVMRIVTLSTSCEK